MPAEAPPQMIETGVAREPEHPGPEPPVVATGVEPPIDPDEDLLGQIAGLVGIADVAQRDPENPALVLPDQGFPGQFIALPASLHQNGGVHVILPASTCSVP